jgi:hypothetical protein
MALLETHASPAWVGTGASGLFRLVSIEGSPGKLNIVVPSVKKSTYLEPTTRTSLSAGLLLTEEAPCEEEEVADEVLAIDVGLSMRGATVADVAVVEAVSTSTAELDAVEEGVELALSGSVIATPASVDVALVEVAEVRAETMPVLKVPTMTKLAMRTLAAENATRLFFIPS